MRDRGWRCVWHRMAGVGALFGIFGVLCTVEAGATVAAPQVETGPLLSVRAPRSPLHLRDVDAPEVTHASSEGSPQFESSLSQQRLRRPADRGEAHNGEEPRKDAATQTVRGYGGQSTEPPPASIVPVSSEAPQDGAEQRQASSAAESLAGLDPDAGDTGLRSQEMDEEGSGAAQDMERAHAAQPTVSAWDDAHLVQVSASHPDMFPVDGSFSKKQEGRRERRLAVRGDDSFARGYNRDRDASNDRSILRRAPGWAKIAALATGLLVSAFGYSSYKHGGPRVALRIHKLHLKRKLPISWRRYLNNLPVLDERLFPEFEDILPWLRRGARLVKRVPHVSEALADFIGLDEETRRTGIVIKVKSSTDAEARRLVYEVNAHANMVPDNPFFLPIIGAYQGASKRAVYMILPRARADVADYVRARPYDVDVRLAAAEMVYSNYILHTHGFLHRDIKAHNYFVTFDGHVVLADFEGVGVLQQRTPVVGTRGYFAPELSRATDHTEKSDVFALGQTLKRLVKYMRPTVRVPHLRELWALTKRMTAKDPEERPTLKQVMEDPYFDGIDFERLEAKDQGVPFRGDFSIDDSDAGGKMYIRPSKEQDHEQENE
ncbi:rhoptry kinase family protein ROP35 [Toxoplasma gondii GAB2-2007-GAL-DOM2]|uniref:non-specific serine/threonine protein kinase n=3 Tax=Toxoplasma gondii TaxID=5811 RepID=B9QR15_TOXGV|nr:rhoptry kinase family protein ROP35 [Toxoplasma gondii VEG]KFG32210.1 rhoptry kinase family protein ROP35 [Toxoplasma gondii GAB2-2007-GAL-DOM2]KFG33976.1 rhoptry kinase family protein ROP35 [Toxoplasma gondii p89]CEL73590.1 TPA: Rhoptry kinase family protein ROP35 [Toxoplasma gondii VEG]